MNTKKRIIMDILKLFISNAIEQGNYSSVMNGLLSLITEDKMNSLARNEYLAKYGQNIDDIKGESLSVVLDFAKSCLTDDYLSEDEMQNIGLLKLFLHIKDGDFVKFGRKDEVQEVLSLQLEKMYKDNVINKGEAINKAKLQELFGLSYDEFLDVVNVIARRSLADGAYLLDLDTFLK